MSRLLLARHGQSVSNAVRRFQGVQDVALSELGERQAAALGQALRH
ncbi:MAG TPA: phosphoglycerate mutase family protein, partial [Methylomirabilota bacterium]|nr:phosphoglycerate mutase family protein [Methylomirabilota bacterium]